MYKQITQFKDTLLVKNAPDVLYVIEDEKELVVLSKDGFASKKIMPRGNTLPVVFLPGKDELILTQEQLLYRKAGEKEFRLIAEDVHAHYLWKDKIVVTSYQKDGQKLFSLMDLNGKILWEKSLTPAQNYQLIGDDTLFFSAKNERRRLVGHIIYKLSLSTGEYSELINFEQYFKQHSADEGATCYHLVGYHNETLICLVKTNRIIGIDPENGNIKWEIKEWTNVSGEEVNWFLTTLTPLRGDFYNGKYYTLEGNVFACFDFDKRQAILRKMIRTDINGDDIYIKETTLYNGKIYFTAQNQKRKKWNILGVFDIETESIVWQTTIDAPGINDLHIAPEVDDKHIYLNDMTGSLYIFEKTV